MNVFQCQLLLGNTCAADLWRRENWHTPIVPPARVSIEEFESAQHRVQPTGGTSRQKSGSKRKAAPVKKVGSPTSG